MGANKIKNVRADTPRRLPADRPAALRVPAAGFAASVPFMTMGADQLNIGMFFRIVQCFQEQLQQRRHSFITLGKGGRGLQVPVIFIGVLATSGTVNHQGGGWIFTDGLSLPNKNRW
jgi:hypothetical protein